MADTADVVVIGGGVNGASIAYALAARGVKRVVLVEKSAMASGAFRPIERARPHARHERVGRPARGRELSNFQKLAGDHGCLLRCTPPPGGGAASPATGALSLRAAGGSILAAILL